MTHFDPSPQDTLAVARDRYFEANHFGAGGGYDDTWVDFKIGPVPLPFPNSPARVRAVRFHDLHHVLTGYDTDFLGELEISAWELGGGCADMWAAWQLNLSGMAAGAMFIPRRTWRAFVRGRHSQNLYRATYDDALLAREVAEAKRSLGLDRDTQSAGTMGDVVTYAGCLAAGSVMGLISFVLFVPLAIAVNLSAMWRRRAT